MNLGAQRSGEVPVDALTWGVGTEYGITPRVFVMFETFGDNHRRNSYQGGMRVWVVPNRGQIDTTVGAQAGDYGASRWISVGMRLWSPPFLK